MTEQITIYIFEKMMGALKEEVPGVVNHWTDLHGEMKCTFTVALSSLLDLNWLIQLIRYVS
jgi:hypothetical protein